MTASLHERIGSLSIICLLAWLPMAYWTGFDDCFPLTKWLLLLLFGTFSVAFNRRTGRLDIAAWGVFWTMWCLAAACLGGATSTYWRSVPEAALLALPVLVAIRQGKSYHPAKARIAIVGAAVLIAGLALWQAAGGERAGVWISPFSKGAASTIGNPDLFGGFLIFPFALALAPAISPSAGWLWKLAAFVLGAGIIASEARAAWLAATLVGLLIIPRFFLRVATLGLVSLVAAVWLTGSLDARRKILSTSAVKERVWTWKIAARLARDRPIFGHGAGNFRRAYLQEQALSGGGNADYYHYTEYAHLEPLHFWVETGAIGLGLLVWGLIGCFSAWRGSPLRYSDPVVWRGIGAGAAGVMLDGLFSFPFHVVPTAAVFWLFVCTATGGPARGRSFGSGFRLWLVWPGIALAMAFGLRLAYHGIALRTGRIYAEAGRLQEAGSVFVSAARLVPGDARLYWRAGSAARSRGELPAARAWLERGLRLEPDFAELNLELGLVLKELGDSRSAEEAYRSALRSNPTLPHAWNNLGNILAEGGRLEEAEAVQRRAVNLAPSMREARQNLAITLIRLGRRDEALRILGGGK